MNIGKRRKPNFTAEENLHLFNIIENRYAKILEDKKTNRVSVQEKNEAWQEIEKEFNSSSPNTCYRKSASLKLLYENKKKNLRRKIAEEKKQRFLTGGGPLPPIEMDTIDSILMTIVNEKSTNGLPNPYDSDSGVVKVLPINNDDQEHTFEISSELFTENIEVDNKRPSSTFEDVGVPGTSLDFCKQTWKKHKPHDLQLSPAQVLNVTSLQENTNKQIPKTPHNFSRRRPRQTVNTLTSSDVATKYNLLLDKRLILIEKQIQAADDEQEFLKTERSLKLELLKLEIAAKKSLFNE